MQCFVAKGTFNVSQQIGYAAQHCSQHASSKTQQTCNPMTALIHVVTAAQVMLTLLSSSSNVTDHVCRQAFKDAIRRQNQPPICC